MLSDQVEERLGSFAAFTRRAAEALRLGEHVPHDELAEFRQACVHAGLQWEDVTRFAGCVLRGVV